MLKTYPEYAQHRNVGVVHTPSSNVIFAQGDKVAITGALENVVVWDVRKGTLLCSLGESTKYGGSGVTRVEYCKQTDTIAAGYNDGSIKLWSLEDKKLVSRFDGHKSSITCLKFEESGATLYSGSSDTDLIIWDVFGDRGLVKLRGHKNAVTDIVLAASANVLISSSKDRLLKMWDLDTQSCTQTIVGHPSEVWSLALDQEERLLVAGSSDNVLRCYRLLNERESENELKERAATNDLSTQHFDAMSRIFPFGVLERRVKSARAVQLSFSLDGRLLGVQSSGKEIEIFAVLGEDEIKKRRKRRAQRERQKERKKTGEEVVDIPFVNTCADELLHKQVIRADAKVSSFALSQKPQGKEVLVALVNNAIEVHRRKKLTSQRIHAISLPGHPSDIRSLAISSRDEMLLSMSQGQIKIWNVATCNPIRTMKSGYGLCGSFAPGDRHVLIGTKSGAVELYDLNSAECIQRDSETHSEAVYSLELTKDNSGFMTASADKKVCFWEFAFVETEGGGRRLTFECTKTIEMTEGVFCACFSPDGKYLAVSLLDFTVKIYMVETMKFYLSLYGHKLPVMSMAISSDSTLLVTGSADKNVKIWGLDFGDCHRSMFAHDDTVMKVAFLPGTHYFLTSGKDGKVKYWDADKFQHVTTLEGHQSEVWALVVSSDGQFAFTGGHDKSLRMWANTGMPLYLEDQKETEMEEEWEKALETEDKYAPDATEETADATKRNVETVKDAEKIIEALDIVIEEERKMVEYHLERNQAIEVEGESVILAAEAQGKPHVKLPEKSPYLDETEPQQYLLAVIKRIRSSALESALTILTFSQVVVLFGYLEQWIRTNAELFLSTRILFFLLRAHATQLGANRKLKETLESLRTYSRTQLSLYKEVIHYNTAALNHMRLLIDDNSASDFFEVSDRLLAQRKRKEASRVKNYWEDSSEEDSAMDFEDEDDI